MLGLGSRRLLLTKPTCSRFESPRVWARLVASWGPDWSRGAPACVGPALGSALGLSGEWSAVPAHQLPGDLGGTQGGMPFKVSLFRFWDWPGIRQEAGGSEEGLQALPTK